MQEDTKSTDSVFELLTAIRKRPAMYLGLPSIHYLQCFINGWYHRDPKSISDAELFGEFTDWIAKKYKVTSTQGWAKIIEFWSIDEVQALELFYKLLDEFQAMKAEGGKKKFAPK
jgi:hypothetical protein